MKICMISNLYPPLSYGGATGVAQMEAEHLAKKGNKVFVITTSPDKNYYIERMNNVKIYRLSPYNIYSFYEDFTRRDFHRLSSQIIWHLIDTFNFRLASKIKKIIINEKPDIVHVHNFKGLSTLLFNEIKKTKTPIIFTAHDPRIICPKASLLRSNNTTCKNKPIHCSLYTTMMSKFFLKGVDILISPSKSLLNKFKENGLKTKAVTLPNPIKLNKNDLPPKSFKSYDKLKILYAGELAKHKGVQILIKAFEKITNSTLHIYGRGADEDHFKKMAKNIKNVIFHGYAQGFKDLKKAYRKANLTVVPSICSESFGMVILESFMNSTPVVGSRIGGIQELIEHGYNGFLFEPGNINELTNILKELAKDPRILKKFEKNAFKTAKKYEIEKHVNELEKIYMNVIDG